MTEKKPKKIKPKKSKVRDLDATDDAKGGGLIGVKTGNCYTGGCQ